MAMYNRYKGNGSKPERIYESSDDRQRPRPVPKKPPAAPPVGRPAKRPTDIAALIPRKLSELETEDLLLILILYLMYRESGDKELLVILGAMLF